MPALREASGGHVGAALPNRQAVPPSHLRYPESAAY